VLIAEGTVAPHLEKIIKALVRIWQLEIDSGERLVKEIMVIVGHHVQSSFYLPIMMGTLN
jgi:hypothetical protein